MRSLLGGSSRQVGGNEMIGDIFANANVICEVDNGSKLNAFCLFSFVGFS